MTLKGINEKNLSYSILGPKQYAIILLFHKSDEQGEMRQHKLAFVLVFGFFNDLLLLKLSFLEVE